MGNGKDLDQVVRVCDALLNLPDYLMREPEHCAALTAFTGARAYRESFWSANPCYEIACDIANAHKHRLVSREGAKIRSIEDVQECGQICRYRDHSGEYYRTSKAVIIRCLNGQLLDARRMLTAAMQLWAAELYRLSVVPLTPDSIFGFSEYVSRRDDNYLAPIRLTGTVGESFRFKYVIFDYSDSLGRLVEVQPGSNFRGKAHCIIEITASPFAA
jgi:hypothetical protein